MIVFKFRLTREEYYQYNYYTAWSAPSRKKYRIMYFLRVLLLYGAVALLYIISTHSHIIWIDVSVFVFTGLVYLLLVPFFIRRSVHRRVADILSKKENQHVLDEAEIVLSDTGILDKDAVSESRYDWDAIVQFAETPDSYYLYTNSYHAIVIPKRVIRDDAGLKEAERLFDSHLPLQA
ncbi:MAG: YcxB family protein [Chitinophagaceae bacterium]|nr:YcxB family protein [Chitinophagaceae bacterium]